MSHLQVCDLSLSFQQHHGILPATDAVSFVLLPGETVALLGESGCGKSLTAAAMMRLLPPNAVFSNESGVILDNADLLDLPESLMRTIRGKRVAMVFQEPMTALNPVMSIGQQLAEAIQSHHSLSKSALVDKMLKLLEEVDMPEPLDRLEQYPHQLSGGQKQRVVIAMALASEPDVLVADEPTTALDVTIQAQILNLLKRSQQQHQMSLLLITHDLGVVKYMADTVCVMYAGQIVETAKADEFFQQPKHPYSQQLMAAIPGLANREHRLAAIPGSVPTLDDMPKGCRFHPRCHFAFEPCYQEVPSLIELQESVTRCHLYPEMQVLPELPKGEIARVQASVTGEVLLRVENLHVQYPLNQSWIKSRRTYLTAVDNVSFDLHQGRTLALVGESGCGKTTISRAMMLLLDDWEGNIAFEDIPLKQMSRQQKQDFRQKVQIVFQDPFSSMNPRMSVADIISEGMRAHGYSKQAMQQRLLTLIDQVNLPKNCLSRLPHQFSGGQRQRISIARALACEPKILICDEPTSALDVSVQAQILNLLRDLQAEYQMAYLFITHNMGVVSYIADEVMVMEKGKLVEHGEVTQIMTNPQMPYTKQLLSAVLC